MWIRDKPTVLNIWLLLGNLLRNQTDSLIIKNRLSRESLFTEKFDFLLKKKHTHTQSFFIIGSFALNDTRFFLVRFPLLLLLLDDDNKRDIEIIFFSQERIDRIKDFFTLMFVVRTTWELFDSRPSILVLQSTGKT